LAENALLISTVNISHESVEGYAAALVDFGPELIDGYPSAIAAVARLATYHGLALPKPRMVVVTAETLLSEDRELIESAFGAPVFNQYAMMEPSCFWSDCERGSLHMHEEYGVSECMAPSGAPAAPGEAGEVVVTSVLNPLMPLIRYRTGDTAITDLPGALCDCGRTLRTVRSVEGRRDDLLYFPDRGYVGRLDPVFKGVSGIQEAQVIQRSLKAVSVKVVPMGHFHQDQKDQLVRNLAERVGSSVQIDVMIVDQIPRAANGKFRAVVSECRDYYPSDVGFP
jgi:phenylacetate-CoA ligase